MTQDIVWCLENLPQFISLENLPQFISCDGSDRRVETGGIGLAANIWADESDLKMLDSAITGGHVQDCGDCGGDTYPNDQTCDQKEECCKDGERSTIPPLQPSLDPKPLVLLFSHFMHLWSSRPNICIMRFLA